MVALLLNALFSADIAIMKRHILMDSTQPSLAKHSKATPSTNWHMCVLCQTETDEHLQYPLRSTKQPNNCGYASLADDLLRFHTLQHMPMDLNLNRLNDGDGKESTLKAHRAEWHKKCRLKVNKKAFEEQSQREFLTQKQESILIVHTRSAHSQPRVATLDLVKKGTLDQMFGAEGSAIITSSD